MLILLLFLPILLSVLPIFAKVLIFVTKEIDENITKHYAIRYGMVLSLYNDYYRYASTCI